MSHELICSWLGLPPDCWPPDHYRLLGLEPGEGDLALIEQRVHQRLDTVRRYQARHPEPATEAMNRLAQAFVCLTEPSAKSAYDVGLLGEGARSASPPPPPLPPPAQLQGAAVVPPLPAAAVAAAPAPGRPREPFEYLYVEGANGPGDMPPPPPVRAAPPVRGAPPVRIPPPPVRAAPPPPLPAAQAQGQGQGLGLALPVVEGTAEPSEAEPEPVMEAVELPPEPPPAPDPMAPIIAAATSPLARRGLASRAALGERAETTTELLGLWKQLEKHLADPQRELTKTDAAELYKLAGGVEESIEGVPLLGEAGQPGYLIVNLTQLERSRDLLSLTLLQREALERDWRAGLVFLEAHRGMLDDEQAADRRRGPVGRLARALRASLNEQPLTALLVLLVLTAAAVAVWRSTW